MPLREIPRKNHYSRGVLRTTLFAIAMSSPPPVRPAAPRERFCVLGVDPSSAGATGYGVVEFNGATPRMLRYGALKMRTRLEFGARLREIHELIVTLVEEFSPDAVAVESVFTALNVGTTLRLAEVRGVVLLAAAQASIPAHSYSPREVKASIAGYGAATKQQMQQMVRAALGLSEYPEPEDAADALAIALCHAHAARAQARMEAALSIPAAAARRAAPRAIAPAIRNRPRVARIS
ncbi:MAG TPA: crossover junction endodeoxyribonuclease RuvC [Candidatus Acidoferrales bacterium]